jgi:hypothetical protein
MGEGIDIEYVKKIYRNLSDAELVRIASTNAQGLTIEAQKVIKDELLFRNLATGLISAVEAQNETISETEINEFCELFRDLVCPVCSNVSRINAVKTSTTMSFIIFTSQRNKIIFGCPGCLKKANDTAFVTTLLLGWWGFPHGIIKSIQSITIYGKSTKAVCKDEHSDCLKAIILNNIGLVKMFKDQPDKLMKIAINTNNGVLSSANNV